MKAPVSRIPPAHVDRALCVADPRLLPFLGVDPAQMDAVAREEMRSLAGSARTRIRRIVAALNGIEVETDIERSNATSLDDAPVLLLRPMLDRLKAALLNEAVAVAMAKSVGADETDELLGALASL